MKQLTGIIPQKVRRAHPGAALLAAFLLGGGISSAHADSPQGDYQLFLNSQTQKSVAYHCNSLHADVNGGGSLSGDLECGFLGLSVNGGSRVAFQGWVAKVDIPMINGSSKVYLHALNISNLHVAMLNGRSMAYFSVTQNGQIDMVNGESYLYIRSSGGEVGKPSVHIGQLNSYSEVHWCGVRVVADSVVGGARLVEDCDW